MYRSSAADVGFRVPTTDISLLAEQGVLLSTRSHRARPHAQSHKDKGWETFTDAVLRKVNDSAIP